MVLATNQVSSTTTPSVPSHDSLVASEGTSETISPEIQALADGLQHDRVKILNYVHDKIRYVHYFGAKKGAQLTLLEGSGNDFDQCALLVALLRASGETPSYQFGWMTIPYESSDHRDIRHWLKLEQPSTTWLTNFNFLANFCFNRGFPIVASFASNSFSLQRVWVVIKGQNKDYYFDPAFKISEKIDGLNLTNALGFSSNSVMSAAGGTSTTNYVTSLNESSLRNTLTGYTTNFLNYLQSNAPNASVAEVMSGWQIVPATITTISNSLPFPSPTFNPPMAVKNWDNEPTNMMAILKLSFAGTNYECAFPQLQGQRLSLTFDSNGVASLYQDDTLLVQSATTGSGARTEVLVTVDQPYGKWNQSGNSFSPLTDNDSTNVSTFYQRTNATYALLYSFDPDWRWLRQRQKKLDEYRQQGKADTSREVLTESLNIMGMTWALQTEFASRLLEPQLNISSHYHSRFGDVAQEAGSGYRIDAYVLNAGFLSTTGQDSVSRNRWKNHLRLFTYFASALEHGVLEQLAVNQSAGSTIKMLEIASTNGQSVYLANSNSWTAGPNIKNSLANYETSVLDQITARINAGSWILLPQNGSNHLASAGSLAAWGYTQSYDGTNGQEVGMFVNGNYSGGISQSYNDTINIARILQTVDSQPYSFTYDLSSIGHITMADPIDTSNGTFEVQHTDLSLGQPEPRGITLSRYYNGSRRLSNPSAMSGGWIHNYSISAYNVAAPEASLGGTTPQQAAAMIVAATVAANIYDQSKPDPKNWMVTALIAKWGIDQLLGSVSVALGKDNIQFVKQPHGVFTPSANSTMSLTQSGSAYTLQQRHGNAFNFNPSGTLSNIVDQYGKTLTVTYNASNWVDTVTDWKSRSLTFHYSPQRLTNISDSTGRSISYGYSTNAQADLISFTDAENKTWTYQYDTNHQITGTRDALNQLVVTNFYDSVGHVTNQYSQGDSSKNWRIYWTGSDNIEIDPAGNQRHFYYDDQSRLIAVQDQLGNLSQTTYDGQNHVIMTISPMNETNRFIYDAYQNLTASIDPLGYSNRFVFDSQNNLTRTIDRRGNTNFFGYNAKFQLIGTTNAAGNWINYDYDTTDGLLTGISAPVSGSGATTRSFGYDSYGQLSEIDLAGQRIDRFLNSAFGDVLSHTNGRGFVTSFQYNLRRQLTNTVAPSNVVSSVIFDANGNLQVLIDPRQNRTTNFWSPTQKLLGTVFPSTPQGVPAITNIYDNRDWLTESRNPLQQSVYFENDAGGNLTKITDALARPTRFTYDADSRKLLTINPASETVAQAWNARGESFQTTDPTNRVVKRAFDAAGNQTLLTNRNGKIWSFAFDAANRIENAVSPLHRTNRHSYYPDGSLATNAEPSGIYSLDWHDIQGLLLWRTFQPSGQYPYAEQSYQYDANGNCEHGLDETLQPNVSSTVVYSTYDAYDRMSTHTNVNGLFFKYRYDENGNLTNLVYPGNKTVIYRYDSLNRLTNVIDWTNRQTKIEYDLASRPKKIIRPNNTVREMSYDAAGQCTNINEHMANGVPIAYYKIAFTNSGRISSEFIVPPIHAYLNASRTMTADDDNRLVSFNSQSLTNDADGNLTSAPLTNSTLAQFVYDMAHRLTNCSAAGITNTYAYDAFNNRYELTNGTNIIRYIVNPNAALSQTLIRIKNGVTNYYVYGLGLLYEADDGGNTKTYHFDYRGSTVAMSASNGVPTDRMEYSAYGTLTYRSGTNDTPFLYNGRYGVMTDPNGLLYMRARYYNPYIGRFINADPSGFGGGINFYAYADANPISLIDPFGLDPTSVSHSWVESWEKMESHDSEAHRYALEHPTPTYQALAELIPYGGSFVQGARSLFSGDPEAMEQAGNRLRHEGVGGLFTAGFAKVITPAAKSVATPYGPAVQSMTAEARAGLSQVENGATLYKGGVLGRSETGASQFLALENPLNPNYAARYGIPPQNANFEFVLTGRLQPGASVITRPAPGIPPNPGGGIEAVTTPGSFRIDSFHMP